MTRSLKYSAIHEWLRSSFDKTGKCDNNCGKEYKRTEWSLLKGKKYERKRENYRELCVSCHRIYDTTDYQREKMYRTMKNKFGKDARTSKPVICLDKDNKVIKHYYSLTEAAKDLGIIRTAISNVLINKAKTAGGFKWKYNKLKTTK